MVRPSGWDVLGLDADPTPGVVEAVQALAKEFGDFSHDVHLAWSSLNAFGGDTNAMTWVGQSADAFKATFGPLPGRLYKLYVSHGEASDALSAYWPKLQAAQNKADAALRQGQDAEADVTRAAGHADTAAADLKSAQASTDPKASADAQTAHDAAQRTLSDAKDRLAALAAAAKQAHEDLPAAAKECAKALHHAQSDGIHNKHWWQHVGEALSEVGGKIAEWAGEIGQIAAVLAPILNGIALLTVEVPGLDVVTAGLAAADDLIAATAPEVVAAGTAMKATGDGLQGHWSDLGMDAAWLVSSRVGGKSKGGEEGEEAAAGPLGSKNGPYSRLTDEEEPGPYGHPEDEENPWSHYDYDEEEEGRPWYDTGDEEEDGPWSDYDEDEDQSPFEKNRHGDNRAHNKKGQWAMQQGGAQTKDQRRRIHQTMKDGIEDNGNLDPQEITDITRSELGN